MDVKLVMMMMMMMMMRSVELENVPVLTFMRAIYAEFSNFIIFIISQV